MDKYIEWDLENNPKFFTEAHSGKFVDVDVIRHSVCNVNRPDDVPEEVFKGVLNAVAEEVSMIPPAADVAPVVRCRDCVLCRELVKGLYRCEHWGANIEGEPPGGFCSAGVTKEESERKMKA